MPGMPCHPSCCRSCHTSVHHLPAHPWHAPFLPCLARRQGCDPAGRQRHCSHGRLAHNQPRRRGRGGGPAAGRRRCLCVPGGRGRSAVFTAPFVCSSSGAVSAPRHGCRCLHRFQRSCFSPPQDFTCKAPTSEPAKVAQLLAEPRGSGAKPVPTSLPGHKQAS